MTKINYNIFDMTGMCQMRKGKASILPKGAYKCWPVGTVHLFHWPDVREHLNNISCV